MAENRSIDNSHTILQTKHIAEKSRQGRGAAEGQSNIVEQTVDAGEGANREKQQFGYKNIIRCGTKGTLVLLYSVPARSQPENCVRITTLKLLRRNNKDEN